jgi:hypothetical protein
VIGQALPGVRIGDHQDPAGDVPNGFIHEFRGFPGSCVSQVRGGYLGHVPQRQQVLAPGSSGRRPQQSRILPVPGPPVNTRFFTLVG